MHGRWNYNRMAQLICYMYYKNVFYAVAQVRGCAPVRMACVPACACVGAQLAGDRAAELR